MYDVGFIDGHEYRVVSTGGWNLSAEGGSGLEAVGTVARLLAIGGIDCRAAVALGSSVCVAYERARRGARQC